MKNFSGCLLICFVFCSGCVSLAGQRLEGAAHPLAIDASASDVYRLILEQGYNYEVPDHPEYGNHHNEQHIAIEFDEFLNKQVFALRLCHNENVIDTWANRAVRDGNVNDLQNSQKIDRQRNEIKTDASSPAWGKALSGHETVYRWKFKLPAGFVGSSQYTHIHQLKAVGGDESQPIITLTVRKRSTGEPPQEMQLIYRYASDSSIDRNRYLVEKIPLEDFLDEWVEVEEQLVYSSGAPEYEFTAVRVRDGKKLMHYLYDAKTWDLEVPFRTYRPGNTFVRPKWGIYRAILRSEGGVLLPVIGPLRDETLHFADIEIISVKD